MSKRDVSIDIYKGLLVFGMVYCHILQFFVDLSSHQGAEYITWFINAITFSGFVFTFGYTSSIAYFSRDFKNVYKKMLLSSVALLTAFYISGIAFRVFVTNNRLSIDMVKNIVLLNDIPGWSEFIVSFALYILLAVILFKPLKSFVEVKPAFWTITSLLLLTTFIPYEMIESTQLGLLLGTRKFAAFPVIQYMPFYLLGIYFRRYEIGFNKKMLIGSVILSGASLVYMSTNNWSLPSRFPPSIFWIILPCVGLYGYYLLSRFMTRTGYIKAILSGLGQNSLVYLLLSNVIIFALDGTKGLVQLDVFTGLLANLILLSLIHFIIYMTNKIRLAE